jgi:hypothetical protein
MTALLGKNQQQARTNRVACIAHAQNLAAIEAVGSVAGDQKQKNARQELCQANQPKIERAVGDLINLPTNRNGLHFDGGDDEKTRYLEQHEVGMGESYASGFGIEACWHGSSNVPQNAKTIKLVEWMTRIKKLEIMRASARSSNPTSDTKHRLAEIAYESRVNA